jgi:hypothetical protein
VGTLKIYILEHADWEGLGYIRGVYLNEADARRDAELDDDQPHHGGCCDVQAYEVLDHSVGLAPIQGPPRPSEPLIPQEIEKRLWQYWASPGFPRSPSQIRVTLDSEG